MQFFPKEGQCATGAGLSPRPRPPGQGDLGSGPGPQGALRGPVLGLGGVVRAGPSLSHCILGFCSGLPSCDLHPKAHAVPAADHTLASSGSRKLSQGPEGIRALWGRGGEEVICMRGPALSGYDEGKEPGGDALSAVGPQTAGRPDRKVHHGLVPLLLILGALHR